jgi:hypothetical protein
LERADTLREQTSFDPDVLPTSLEASMLVECIPRPELRAPVLGLIQKIATSHAGGPFALSLADLFAAIGLTLETSEWDKLGTRGDVSFVPRGDSHGAFNNQGPAQEVAMGEGLTLVVPETRASAYL